jgi:hypothetical protein
VTRLRTLLRLALGALGDDAGQEITEYAIITFFAMISLFFFLPKMIGFYKLYITGFYLLLGLPIP